MVGLQTKETVQAPADAEDVEIEYVSENVQIDGNDPAFAELRAVLGRFATAEELTADRKV